MNIFSIRAPHFTAGGTIENDKVDRVAPIIAYMHGWRRGRLERYCSKKKWRLEIV